MDIQNPKEIYLRLLVTIIIAFQFATIWSVSNLFPFQDYYDWLFQSKVLFELWNGNPFATQHFEILSFWEFPPNGFVTFFLAFLQFFVPLETAGKILLSFILLLFNFGGYKLIATVQSKSPYRFLIFIFTFHFFFYKGFLSYCLGLAVLLNLIAFLFTVKHKSPAFIFIVILGSSLLTFAIHGFIFGVSVFVLIIWLIHIPHSLLSIKNKSISLLALTPGIFLLGLYIISSSEKTASLAVLYETLLHWMQVLRYGSHFFSRIALNTSLISLSVFNVLIPIFLLIVFIHHREKIQARGFSYHLFVSFFLMMVLNPFYQIGLFFPLSSRLILLVILLFTTLYTFKEKLPRLELLILCFALFISLGHFIHIKSFDQKNSDLVQALESTVQESDVLIIGKTFPKDFDKSFYSVLSGTTNPYLFLNSAINKETLFNLPYIQETGVVRLKSEEARTKSKLGELVFNTYNFEDAMDKLHSYSGVYHSEYKSIILIGTIETKTRIAHELSGFFSPSDTTDHFIILERTDFSTIK